MVLLEKSLRVAVVGCGTIGRLHALAIQQSPLAELVAVCDVQRDRATDLARSVASQPFDNHRDLLSSERPHVVTIATPNHLHVNIALDALMAGCHVFCEKPLAMDAGEAEQLVTVASQRDLHLAVNYNRRFAFGYQLAKQWIDAGQIGRIGHAAVEVSDGAPPKSVATCPEIILTTLLTHHLDLIRWFCGEILEVHSTFGERSHDELIRHVVLSLRCESGTIASLTAGYRDGQLRTTERMVLAGDKGQIVVDDVLRAATRSSLNPDSVEVFQPSPFTPQADFWHTIAIHLHDFLERVTTGGRLIVSGKDGWRGLRIVAAAIQSHAARKPVEVRFGP